jgi:urease accessory protein
MPRLLTFLSTLLFLASPAWAAEGVNGVLVGFLHPVLGFDHLLAMIAVGLLSIQLGGRHIWSLPVTFVAFLAIGGIVGLFGIPLPQVEGIIALSVLLLGFAIATQTTIGTFVAYPMVAIFAIFHGHAHGAEIPDLDGPMGYVSGFMLASAALHLLGVSIGAIAKTSRVRGLIGAVCAGVGLHMVLLTYGLV